MTVKFKTEFIDNNVPQDSRMDELKYWCSKFQDLNLTPLYKRISLGNLSFRLKENADSFIITASSLALKDHLTKDSFVTVLSYDLKNEIIYANGTRKPSSESRLHFTIYNQRKDVNAVFHGHSGKILHSADRLKITTTKQFEDYGSAELAKSVLEVLNDDFFLVMKNHGFLALGKNMEAAGELALQMYRKCIPSF
jgi:L-fuculose-phosphate aldolase